MIPYGKQSICDADVQAVIDVLNSDFITQGPVIEKFEKAVAKKVGCDFSVACNSATSALHLACLALNVGKESVVWTSPISFVASANCALYCGAKIDFIDIDPTTYNMSSESLSDKLQKNRSLNLPLPNVVIVVHMAGYSCDMNAIKALSDEYQFKIIEDASHAIGANDGVNPVGACAKSDITIFSFHPVKIITTGEGGMALTNDRSLAYKMANLRSHGIQKDVDNTEGAWYYEQHNLGFNYRMTDVQAALGLSQLQKLDKFIQSRRELAANYFKLLKSLPVQLPYGNALDQSSWHLFIIHLTIHDRFTVFNKLREAGVGAHVHYIPIYFQPYYQKMGFKKGLCPKAESYYESALSLPIFHGMTEIQQRKVVRVLEEILQ